VSLVVVNQGEEALLNNGLTGVAYTLRLHTTDVTAGLSPAQVDALDETDFTEATFTGYTAQAISPGDWTVTLGDPTEARNVAKSFTASANQPPQDIWGYYVTRQSDGALIWFEPFDGPIVVEFTGDQINVTPTITLDDAEGNAVQTGTMTAFGGATAPSGWLLCNGSAVSRTTFAGLFAVIGTTYGAGDGSTTFNLPDLRQRFPLGKAAAGTGATLGSTGGSIDHVHDLDTASSHARITWTAGDPEVSLSRKTVSNWTNNIQVGTGVSGTLPNAATSGGTQSTATGVGGNSGTANPPYQVVNWIIRT
jgi:microcystin-dependent protein